MELTAFIGNEVKAFVVKFLDFLRLWLKLFLEISRDELISVVFLVLLFLMELKMFLDDVLDVLLSETLDQVKLILENDHTEEHFPVFELSLTELEFSHFSNLFYYCFNLTLQILIESN